MEIGIIFALLTAILFGIQAFISRVLAVQQPTFVLIWATCAFSLPLLGGMQLWQELPQINWGPWATAFLTSIFAGWLSLHFFFRSLAIAPAVVTMPFVALTPLFMQPIAYFLLGEVPSATGWAGILMIIAGSFLLRQTGRLTDTNLGISKGINLMILVSAIWALSSTVDKVAILNSSPLFHALMINAGIALVMTPRIVFLNENEKASLKKTIWKLALPGFIAGLLVLTQFIAISYLNASYVIALKRCGVLITMLLAWFFLSEQLTWRHLLPALILLSGIALLLW